jgi:hypothetical protein
MPKAITRFQCIYCPRHYSTKYDAGKHEKKCLVNPDNHSCSTCDFAVNKYCHELKKPIFVRGEKIVNCPSWVREEDYLCLAE